MRYTILIATTLALLNLVGAAPIFNSGISSVQNHPVAKRQDFNEVGAALGGGGGSAGGEGGSAGGEGGSAGSEGGSAGGEGSSAGGEGGSADANAGTSGSGGGADASGSGGAGASGGGGAVNGGVVGGGQQAVGDLVNELCAVVDNAKKTIAGGLQ